MADTTDTTTTTAKSVPLSADAEAGYKLQIEDLSRELRLAREELAAYKQLEAERDAAAKAAKGKRDAQRSVEPRALMPIVGKGRRMVAVGETLFPEELDGFELGKHYEYAPVI